MIPALAALPVVGSVFGASKAKKREARMRSWVTQGIQRAGVRSEQLSASAAMSPEMQALRSFYLNTMQGPYTAQGRLSSGAVHDYRSGLRQAQIDRGL